LPKLCPRMARYAAEPNVVSEPVWHKMACLLKSLNPDSTLFHEWSRGYDLGPGKRYNWAETERKFRASQALPIHCSTFEALDPMPECRACPHFMRGSSPTVLVRQAYAESIGQRGIYGAPARPREEIRLDGREVDNIIFDGLPSLSDDEHLGEQALAVGMDEYIPTYAYDAEEGAIEVPEDEAMEALSAFDESRETAISEHWRKEGLKLEHAVTWMKSSGNRAIYYDEDKEKWKLTLWEFAKILYEDFLTYYFYSGINVYNGQYFEFPKDDEQFLKRFIAEALAWRNKGWVTPSILNNIIDLYETLLIGDHTRNIDDVDVANQFDVAPVFPCLNGLLDVSDLTNPRLVPFDPSYRCLWQIDAVWDPRWAENPARWTLEMQQVERDVNELFCSISPDPLTRKSLLECAGYSLARFDMSEQRYFMLYGPGHNGKGTFLRILEALCGKFVQTVTLQDLAENRFAASRLTRAAINIVADASTQTLKDTETIKKLTGNDLLTAEMKYREAFAFRPRVKLWFAANYLPPTPDASFGYFRRPLIFPFHRQLPMKPADWEKRLRTPEAKSYLLYLAIKHYLNMRAEGRKLTESKEMLRTRMDYWAANDIVQAAIQYGIFEFPDSQTKDRKDYVVPRALATKAIELFAEELGRKKVSTNTLLERLRGNYADIKEVFATCEDGKRRHVWEGVRLGEIAYELKRVRHVPDPRSGEMVVITSYLMDEYEAEVQKGAEAVRKRWDAQKYAGRKAR
ncbi:MAG: DUF5906 domain-containing protein, partial [Alicyclobacillus sp.]|nr:DUF5906 domain-containing protein [Alicyclobacillus sp.]